MTAPQFGHLWITSLTESTQKGIRQQPNTRPNRHRTTHSRMHMPPGWYTVLVETVAWHAGHTHISDLCKALKRKEGGGNARDCEGEKKENIKIRSL